MGTNRRDFLKQALGASTLLTFSGTVPGFLCQTARAAGTKADTKGNVLVVIQLSGGNDGLNTVVPYEDDAYQRNRPTLRLTANQVHKLENGLGLHSEMEAAFRLYREGQLSIVQGVGYPNSKRDHDAAKRDWHTGRPKDELPQTGWIGRAVDRAYQAGADVPGVFTGPIRMPFSLQTEDAFVPSLRTMDQWSFSKGNSAGSNFEQELVRWCQAGRSQGGGQLLEFLRTTTLEACASAQRVRNIIDEQGSREYPQADLARTLRTVAQLIRAGLGIRIYFAELGGGEIGGFDTHAGQAANHGALLKEFAESVAAFTRDLAKDKLLDSVVLMTFSEFGRTLSENGRRGTNHGAAAPIFVAGGRLKGGLVGEHPSLTDLEEDAPKFHTDFRRVYASVLDNWLGLDSSAILGERFAPLEGLFS